MRRPFFWKRLLVLILRSLMTITALVCAVIIWPEDLAWGLLVVAVLVSGFSFEVEFE